MNITKKEWTYSDSLGVWHISSETNPKHLIASVDCEANAQLISASPDMYEALKEADKLIALARQFFPKSIHNSDKFQLENTCATIGKAIAKAEGK
ncbi:MAG: hypothetical protein WC516_08150 [Patescibacteria group bacterium]|jgi:hypothetical protein